MLMRLVRPVKRSGSSVPQFVKRIPADVRDHAIGKTIIIPVGLERVPITITPAMQSIRVSLKTREPAQVRARQAEICATLEKFFDALRRTRPVSLTHRQCVALAGYLYRGWTEDRVRTTAVELVKRGDPWRPATETPQEAEAAYASSLELLGGLIEQAEDGDLETPLGPVVDRLLLKEGIGLVDAETRPMLLEAALLALKDAYETRRRNAQGDYSPDPKANRFPQWEPLVPATPPVQRGAVTLTGLVDSWWREAKALGRKPSTHESYRNTMDAFVAFLGHDDAQRVTVEDVIRFKDYRLTTPSPKTGRIPSPKTVKDSDLAGLKTVFGWAVANRKVAANPALGVTLKLGKPRKLRSKGFTEEEAKALLSAAWNYKPGQERPRTAAAKRWVPFLCAYTGARVGEVAQLRKQDVRQESGHWIIRITPEAGTVKTDEAREVVLHSHLVELGFPEFVEAAPEGHLFIKPAKDGDVLGPLQGLKNRLAEFAREVVTDPNVAPNHGWRHRFKTIGMEAEIPSRILDAIQGQAPRSVADTYGDVTIKTIAAAISKLPRVEVVSC